MALFRLRDRVRRIAHDETRIVEEIREGAGEPTYSIQLGLDLRHACGRGKVKSNTRRISLGPTLLPLDNEDPYCSLPMKP